MRRTVLLLLAILFLPVPATAIIYQCRDNRGTLFLTDDPDNLPAKCVDRQTRLQKKDVEAPATPPAPSGETLQKPMPDKGRRPDTPLPEGAGRTQEKEGTSDEEKSPPDR